MRTRTLCGLALVAASLLAPRCGWAQEPDFPEDIWAVASYDSVADPADHLKATVARAQEEGKRILLQVGGEWCGWCHRLDRFLHDHPAIMEELRAGFLIMKVNFSPGNRNEAFLSQYPDIRGYPHLYVLERDGTFLHSQQTDVLEEGPTYVEQKILDFLRAWRPETQA